MVDFLTDITKIRERARAEISKGPITDAHHADVSRVIQQRDNWRRSLMSVGHDPLRTG